MSKLELTFDILGSVKQTIQILVEDTPEQFVSKLASGEYITSISSSEVIKIDKNFTVVGQILEQETLTNTEFHEFEKGDEEGYC